MKGERQPTLNNRLGNVRWRSQFRLLITLLDAATIAGIGGATDQDEDGETTAGAEPGFDVTAAADGAGYCSKDLGTLGVDGSLRDWTLGTRACRPLASKLRVLASS